MLTIRLSAGMISENLKKSRSVLISAVTTGSATFESFTTAGITIVGYLISYPLASFVGAAATGSGACVGNFCPSPGSGLMIGGILYSLTSPEFNATAKNAPSIDNFASLGK